jgi:autotransporter-associated beta strand protein
LNVNGGGVSIAGALSTPGKINILGNVATTTNSGVNLASTGSITTSGSGSIIKIQSNGNVVAGGAIGNTGSSGATSSINLTSTSGSVSGSGTMTSNGVTASGGGMAIDTALAGTMSGVISGTGSLTKMGAGTTILTAANSYSGTTTVSAGVLQVGDGGTTGSLGTGAVIDNASLVFNRSNSMIVANAISGTGSLTQAGTGTTILTSENSYTGTTTVSAGVLQIGNGGTTGTLGTGAVIDNASLVFNRSNSMIVANAISGTGSLTQAGTGTTILTSENSYTGTTTVSAGTLQVGNGGTTGTLGTGAVIDNASLVFNRSNLVTVANAISGTGSLTQSGTGTTILSGDNTYTGTTTVSGGTLQIGNGGATGTLGTGGAVTLSNSANLNFLRSASTTIANNISGTGNVSASITGASSTLTVSNPINLTGSTTSNVVNLAADNNISVAAAIATTNTTDSAVLLNAGKSTNAGTSTGGDISLSGSGAVNVGTGGRATLMTGSVTGSTGLTALVGAGSGNFRYNSDETTTNYSTVTNPLGSGLYGIYREAPVITATVNPVIKTYDGIAYSGGNGVGAFSGLLNGDSAQLGTITYTGTSQGAKNASTSTYGLSGTASSGLGYAVSLTPGTLTINKANLTQVTATKTYDGLSTVTGGAQMTAIAGVNGETFTASGTAAISDKNVATAGKTLTDLSGLTLTGNTSQALSSNYNLSSNLPAAGTNNAVTITAKTVSLAATKTYDGSTSMTSHVTVTTGITGESLGYTGVTANSKDVVSADRITAITLTDNGAALASNYQLPSLSVVSADNTATISKANFTQVTAAKTYDRLSTVTGGQMTVIAGVNGETFTSSAGTATISSPNVATANKTLTDLSGLTLTGNTSLVLSSNYNLSSNLPAAGANNAVTITALTLTPTITASDKTYDQTNAAALTSQSISGVISGDTVSLSTGSTNTFASADVARNNSGNVTSQTVTASGLSLSGADASNYALSSTTATTSATINPKSVTVAITASDKIYDQTATATVTRTTSDIFSSDVANVTIGSTSNTFASADVARSSGVVTSQTVTSSGLSLTGTKAGNYALTNATATTTATISPKSLTASVTASDKTYDKTNAATITGHTSADIIAGDAVTISSTGAIFASANVARDGSGNVISQNVTASGLTLAGAQAGNYALSNASASASTTATINPKTVSLTATKTYDGNTALTGSQLVLGDLLSGESLSFTGATLNDKNVVGAAYVNAVTLVNSGTTLASNYQAPVLTAASTGNTASVTPAALAANLTGTVSKVYDALTNATLSGSNFNVTGWVSGEGASVTQTAGTYASTNVDVNGGSGAVSATLASNQFTANSGTLLSNYTLPTSASGNVGNITPAALRINVGNTSAFVTQDANTAIDTGFTYTDLNGSAPGFKGADTAATALVQVPVAANRTFTGTSNTPTVSNTPPVGNYSSVYGLNFTPTAQHGNYTVTVQKGNLKVEAADKLIVTPASQSDTYGNRTAGTAGQANTVTAQYCFNASNCNGANIYSLTMTAGSGNQWSGTDNTGTTVSFETTVSTAGNLSGGGFLKAGNYSWDVANLNATAATPYNGYVVNSGTLTVNKLAITPTASNVSKVYDGTTSAAGVTLNTLQAKGGDTVSALAGSGIYTTKSVVSNDTVTFGSLTLSGADKDNYALAVSSVQGTGSITPANLTVTATAVTKTYDGTTSTTALGSVGALAGSGDKVNSAGSQSYTNKNAGTGKTVQATGVTIKDGSGADMTGNYTITYVDNTTSVINQANLTVTATQVSKTYDGTTTATGTGSVGTLAGAAANETVSSAGTQAFSDKNFGVSNRTVIASGVTIQDSNNADVTGNYNIAYVNNTTSTINKADLTVTAQAVTKVYDGTTTASGHGLVGALAGAAAKETVSSTGTQAFLDKNAGTGNKTVQASGVTIKDASNADVTVNYNVNYVNNTVSTITPAALSANLTGTVSKVYDATTNATLSGSNFNVTGWISGEGASVTQTAGTYASANVDVNGGSGAVSATLASSQFTANSGTLMSNYTVPTSASGNVGTITPAALRINVGNTSAFVTQNANTAIDTGVSYTDLTGTSPGFKGSDTAANALMQVPVAANRTYTGASTPAVGNYNEVYGLNFTPTAKNGNYTITVQKGNLEVVPANHILITIPSQSATYGIRTVSTAGQASNVTAQYCFNATDCNGANLYSLAMTAGTGNTWTALDNVGTTVSLETTVTTAGNLSTSGYLKAGNYTYGVTNVVSTPTAQYSGVTINGGTLTVDKLSLTPTTTDVSKVYDASKSAAGVSLNLAAVKSGDAVTGLATSGTYTTQNVVNNDTVTFGGLSLSGADKDNYALATTAVQTSGAITPRALTLQAASDSKTYDGSTSSTGTVTVSGLAPSSSDSVTSLTQAFASKNVMGANRSTLNVNSGYTVNDGNSGNNYTVTNQSASGTITTKSLSLAAVTATKTYDGTTASAASVAVSGIADNSGDTVTSLSQSFGSKNVLGTDGSLLSVNSGYSVNDGNSGGNYSVSTSTAAGTITPKTLSLAAVTETKVYDGSTTSTGSVAISGIASGSGDTVTNLTQSFANKNVLGTGLSVLSVNSGFSVNDGNFGRNYRVEPTSAAGTITPKALTLTAVPDSKIYDGTTSSSGTVAISGLASGSSDFVTAVQSFGSKNVLGTDVSTLSVNSGYSVSDGNSGNNYAVTTQSAKGTITPKALTLAAVTDTKTYDGTTRSSVSVSVSGIAANSGDTVTGLSQTFGSKNVLGTNGSTLTVDTGYTVNDGNSGRNYSVGTTGTTGTINKADLTVTATQVTKTYDASVNATGNGTVGSLAGAGDSVNSQGAQAFLDANAGTNKTVRASGVTIKDANSQDMTANYNIIYADNTSSAINKANLTITANADARFVTQTDATGFNGVNYSGLVGGESGAVLSGTLAIERTDASTNLAAGSYPGSLVPSGLASDNYTISFANGNYTILPANQLLIRTTNTSTTYGTTPTFSTTAQYLNGTNNVINTLSRSVSGNITTFSDNAGGSVKVNLQPYSGNTPAGVSSSGNTVVGSFLIEDKNPLITGANFLGAPVFVGNLDVNQKAVTPSASGLTKVYDGTTAMGNATLGLTGQVTGDTLGVSGNGVFNQKNVGTQVGYAFNNLALSGADQGNYYFSGGNSLSGNNGAITPAPLRLTTTNVTKTFDGTLSAAGSATVTGGTQLFGNDTIGGGSFAFTNKNAGTANKTVTTSAVTVTDGNNGGNYAVSYVDNTTSTIHQAALTVTAAAAQKTYDGTLSVSGTGIVGALAGAGDSVANAGSLSFTDKNAGTGKTVTVTGVQIKDASGADMTGNYAITYSNSNAGVINKLNATITAPATSLVYNGQTQSQGTAVLSGFVAGDSVQTTGLASGRNAGSYLSSLSASGADVGNYTITYVNAPLVINKLDATITASATSWVYNGQTQSQGSAVLSGFVAGDSVQATGLASGRNAGSYLSSLSATGADVGNYNITYNNASLNISKRPASLSALGQNVIYNGQTQSLNGTQGSGFVAGDALNFSGLPSGRNVGQYTSAMTVSGSDAANYDVTLGSATLTITPKTASVTALPERVTYNGQTQQQSAALLEGFIAGDDIRVSGLASGRNAGVYGSNALATGQDVGNYSITYQQGALTIDKAPLQFVGTSAADKQYDGNTQASVMPGRITGLVGHESLSMLSLSGQFDTAEPGSNKPVTVVYGLGDGQNGGLAANYDWSPVKVTASIRRETSSHQATPEAPRPVGKYSRLTYLGFGGLTGIGAATGQVYYAARNTDAQQCTPRKLEECICERPQEGALEICYPKGEAKQAAQLP